MDSLKGRGYFVLFYTKPQQKLKSNGSQYHQMFCLDKGFLSPSSCAGFKGVLKM